MGSSNSKHGHGAKDRRQTSTSSTTPLTFDVSTPTTPTPLLAGFQHCTFNQDALNHSPSSPSNVPNAPSPTLPSLDFSPSNNPPNEIIVTSFSGDSPQNLPSSTFARHSGTFEEIHDISKPKPARPHIRHLSELIDPIQLVHEVDEKAIRSPSGHLLGRQSFEERDDRPLSMRERQERVRQRLEMQRRQAEINHLVVPAIDNPKTAADKKGRRSRKKIGFCCCFGR